MYNSVMVNFMCQFDWARDALITGKTLFLNVSMRVSGRDEHLSPSTWVKKIPLISVGGHHPLCWGPKKQKGELVLSAWAGTFIFSCPRTLALLVLGPSDSDRDLHHWLPWFWGHQAWTGITPLASLNLQGADSRSWDFSTSVILWANPS